MDMVTSAAASEQSAIDPLDACTLRQWITQWANSRPGSAAIRGAAESASETISFAVLERKALALAAFLHHLGLRRGDVIAAQLPNSVEFVITYLACGYIGATLQTIHMPYRAAEIEPLLAHSGARAMICLDQIRDFSPADLLVSLRAKLPRLDHIVAVASAQDAAISRPGVLGFPEAGLEFGGASLDPVPATERFLLLYTSGTTAAPKGVPVSYRHFLPNAALSARELRIDHNAVLLSAAPFTHLYGLFSLNLAFAAGAATALLPGFTPAALADAIDRFKPTGLFVAPAHMAACLQAGLLTRERMRGLRFALISGSACPPELAKAVQEVMEGGEVLQLWGMSELQAGAFTRPGDDATVRFGTAGRASPCTELRVVQDGPDGILAAPGTEGELWVRGRSLFSGYLNQPRSTADAVSDDGWFRTGDLACMDDGGNIKITGRLKDVINRGGVKFNPVDIEALIECHPAVASCAIVAMPDPVLGERACCFIVPKAEWPAPRLDEICRYLAEHQVAKLKWPERLEVLEAMPMTPTRKIMKAELTRRATAAP
jgi:cyclohexanecarboxylate-CoA ligase/acyl-CoA synthetase